VRAPSAPHPASAVGASTLPLEEGIVGPSTGNGCQARVDAHALNTFCSPMGWVGAPPAFREQKEKRPALCGALSSVVRKLATALVADLTADKLVNVRLREFVARVNPLASLNQHSLILLAQDKGGALTGDAEVGFIHNHIVEITDKRGVRRRTVRKRKSGGVTPALFAYCAGLAGLSFPAAKALSRPLPLLAPLAPFSPLR